MATLGRTTLQSSMAKMGTAIHITPLSRHDLLTLPTLRLFQNHSNRPATNLHHHVLPRPNGSVPTRYLHLRTTLQFHTIHGYPARKTSREHRAPPSLSRICRRELQ